MKRLAHKTLRKRVQMAVWKSFLVLANGVDDCDSTKAFQKRSSNQNGCTADV